MQRKLFRTGQRSRLNYLGPITNQAQMLHLAIYSQHTSSPRGGCSEQLRLVQTNSNVSFPRSHEYLTGGYTSPDFVTVRYMCAITTALHSPTSINRRLLAASKVESLSLSNPPFWTFTNLSIGVSAGTHNPSFQRSLEYSHHREPPH